MNDSIQFWEAFVQSLGSFLSKSLLDNGTDTWTPEPLRMTLNTHRYARNLGKPLDNQTGAARRGVCSSDLERGWNVCKVLYCLQTSLELLSLNERAAWSAAEKFERSFSLLHHVDTNTICLSLCLHSCAFGCLDFLWYCFSAFL